MRFVSDKHGQTFVANNARARKAERMRTRGWFDLPERPGDRTLAQQLRGLEPMLNEAKGKRVLDVGCAEGLISLEVAYRGARSVHGYEIVPGHVAIANRLAKERGLPCVFIQADMNRHAITERYDVVLLLAVLHKFSEPAARAIELASLSDDLCVIRMSPDGTEIINDARSLNVPQDIGSVMRSLGFVVERRELGPFDEVTWYYRRAGK